MDTYNIGHYDRNGIFRSYSTDVYYDAVELFHNLSQLFPRVRVTRHTKGRDYPTVIMNYDARETDLA
jgi:hypothetical protein